MQETLLAIHQKRHTWREDMAVRPWLYAIVRYKVVDAFRARGRRVQVPIEDFADVLPAPDAADPTERGDTERVIARLDPRSARIVRAIGLDGASVAETSAALGMTETAVRVALHRALRKLAGFRAEDDRMRTDELIRAMAADSAPGRPVGAGARRDHGRALGRGRPSSRWRRCGLNPALDGDDDRAADAAAPGVPRCCSRSAPALAALRLARPGATAAAGRWLLVAAPVLAGAVVLRELALVPPDAWGRAALGATHARLPGLARADRRCRCSPARSGRSAAAPRTRPRASGALAGLLAGAIAAAIYALHCTGDSPLFYAVWYGLGILAVTGARRGARAAPAALVARIPPSDSSPPRSSTADGGSGTAAGDAAAIVAVGGSICAITALAERSVHHAVRDGRRRRRRATGPAVGPHRSPSRVEARRRGVAHPVLPRMRQQVLEQAVGVDHRDPGAVGRAAPRSARRARG